MEEQIKMLDASLLEIQPIAKYLKQFKNYKIIKVDIQNDNGEIDILAEDETIKLNFLNMNDAKWWSILRHHPDGTRYEQIDIIIYDEIKDDKYNKIIKYSGHIEDDNYSYIVCSSLSYLNDEIIRSWKKSRVVHIEDLKTIQYCKDMNLAELILMTDKESSNIIKKENLENIKTLKLEIFK